MKALAVVILYNPDSKECAQRIMRYLPYIDELVIWDNTESENSNQTKILNNISSDERKKIEWVGNYKNEGIAIPVNYAFRKVLDEGFSFVMTMDQDSSWENADLYIKNVKSILLKEKGTILCPNVEGRFITDGTAKEVETFITSGTVFSADIIRKIGMYDERFFVDALDWEYSMRAKRHQVKINVLTDCALHQNFGYPLKSKIGNIVSSNYSAKRTYYIVKNHIMLYRLYKNELSKVQKTIIFRCYIISRFFKILFIEGDKFNKMSAICRGMNDGFCVKL